MYGFAYDFEFLYTPYSLIRQQQRISSAVGHWLEFLLYENYDDSGEYLYKKLWFFPVLHNSTYRRFGLSTHSNF